LRIAACDHGKRNFDATRHAVGHESFVVIAIGDLDEIGRASCRERV